MQDWVSLEGAIAIRTSEWPLLRVRLVQVPTLDEFRAMLAKLTEILNRGESYAIVTESGLTEALPVMMLRLDADWHKANAEALAQHCCGIAMVVPNVTPQRSFAASTVRSMSGKQATQMQVFGDVGSATAWARQCLAGFRPAKKRARI